MVKVARWLILAGSVVLLATAVLHGSGFRKVSLMIAKSGLSPLAADALKALWLMFSIHLAVLSVVFVVASRTLAAKRLVLLCALIPVADTLLMFRFLGVFVGTISILSAALLFLIGGALLPSGAEG